LPTERAGDAAWHAGVVLQNDVLAGFEVDDVRALDVDGRLSWVSVGLLEDAIPKDLVRHEVLVATVDLAQPGVDGASALVKPSGEDLPVAGGDLSPITAPEYATSRGPVIGR
jgi:hypothetical protein